MEKCPIQLHRLDRLIMLSSQRRFRIWEYRESKVDAMVGMNTFLKSLEESPHFIERMRAVLSMKYETTPISAWIEKVPQSRLVPYVFEPNF